MAPRETHASARAGTHQLHTIWCTVAVLSAALGFHRCQALTVSNHQLHHHRLSLALQAQKPSFNSATCGAQHHHLQQKTSAGRWLRTFFQASTLALALAATAADAENELSAQFGGRGFDASLIDTECLASRCEVAATSCLESNGCRKGMTCIAKCLGDNACITGCFAKYGNNQMNGLLDCSVEKHGCVKIAILPPGPYESAPPPPVKPIEAFEPASMKGTWYKVLGWNSRYDCFDCQKNSFSSSMTGRRHFDVDVEFAMPRPGKSTTSAALSYPLKLEENMVFDDDHSFVFENGKLVRHASTVGHLFGLTFWENWSVIGQNQPGEDEWKFVYYTGKTTQNTYEGAFVYARQPELPKSVRKDVYAIAAQAGIDPSSFCLIRNDRRTCNNNNNNNAATVPADDEGLPRRQIQRGLFVGAATAAEDPSLDDALDSGDIGEEAKSTKSWYRILLDDLSDYFEDPRQSATWLFNQQIKVPPGFFE